jgi:hypothetical protein
MDAGRHTPETRITQEPAGRDEIDSEHIFTTRTLARRRGANSRPEPRGIQPTSLTNNATAMRLGTVRADIYIAEPADSRIDEWSGQPTEGCSGPLGAEANKAIIANRPFSALNTVPGSFPTGQFSR